MTSTVKLIMNNQSGVPKSGYMIESMTTTTAHDILDALDSKAPSIASTWNAVCLGVTGGTSQRRTVAIPQIPSHNVLLGQSPVNEYVSPKSSMHNILCIKVRKGATEPLGWEYSGSY